MKSVIGQSWQYSVDDKLNWKNLGIVVASEQTNVPSGAKEIIIQGAKTDNFTNWETCSIHLPVLTTSQSCSVSGYDGIVMTVYISPTRIVNITTQGSTKIGYYRVFWR